MGKERYQMGWVDVNTSDLVKADWNYKEENAEQTLKLVENFKRNGQVENIQIRELEDGRYEVVNGNHRLDVMKSIEMKKCHAYNYGEISKAEAQRIAIETNETRFATNAIKLGETLEEISGTFSIDEMAKTMPFKEEEISNMIETLNFDWEQFDATDDDAIDLEAEDVFDNTIKLLKH